jgi:hypothetical protein
MSQLRVDFVPPMNTQTELTTGPSAALVSDAIGHQPEITPVRAISESTPLTEASVASYPPIRRNSGMTLWLTAAASASDALSKPRLDSKTLQETSESTRSHLTAAHETIASLSSELLRLRADFVARKGSQAGWPRSPCHFSIFPRQRFAGGFLQFEKSVRPHASTAFFDLQNRELLSDSEGALKNQTISAKFRQIEVSSSMFSILFFETLLCRETASSENET